MFNLGLNPFKDSNLNDLQQKIKEILKNNFGELSNKIKERFNLWVKKGKERITIMLIPHSEKKISSFHIKIFTLILIISLLIITVTITSIAIINHSSTIKGVSRLKMYDANSKMQIQKYKKEINTLYSLFQKFKPQIKSLYSLTPKKEKDANSLWAKGGGTPPNLDKVKKDPTIPPIELLNIEEMGQDLEIIKNVLKKIKIFLEKQKKTLENTPSFLPVNGYIIQKYGNKISSNIFQKDFHKGIDIAAFPGSKIRATAPGKVEDINWDSELGLTISIIHKYGFTTKYSHCHRITVKKDQYISKGDLIGYVGRTGRAIKHKCFYQLKIGTEYVDPFPYLNRLKR